MPASTAVEATPTSMKPTTATVDCAEAICVDPATGVTPMVSTTYGAANGGSMVAVRWAAAAVAWPITVTGPAVAVAGVSIVASTIPTVTVIAATVVAATVIPGTSADEDAANEVARTVVAIGCASVWIVAVIPISADRGWTDANSHGANTDADRDLGFGLSGSGEKQDCE